MAVTLGDALIFIRGDDSKLDDDLGSAERKTRGWASKLGGTAAKLVGGAIVAGAAAAGAAIVGIGIAAFDTAAAIDDATDKIQSQLGLNEEQAESFGDTIARVYANNFGGSVEDVGQAVADVHQGIDQKFRLTADEIGNLTEHALALRDAFDTDVNESTQAANQLMLQFGVTGEEAFEIIAAGMQFGVNKNEDLLDTLHEYAADFDDLGFTADQVLSTLNSGLGAGILNTDKIADAFREFKINLLDAGRIETIKGINEDLDQTVLAFQRGEITGRNAFSEITSAIQDMEDPVTRQTLGVAFMGSMWEDLGEEAILAIDTWSDSLTDNSDVLASLGQQYDNFGSFFEGMKRRALVALAPIGENLLELANGALPTVEKVFNKVSDVIGIFFGNIEAGANPMDALRHALSTVLPGDLADRIFEVAEKVDGMIAAVLDSLSTLGGFQGESLEAIDILNILIDVLNVTIGIVGFLADVFSDIIFTLDRVGRGIQSVINWIGNLGGAFSNLRIPPLFVPGSLPPLAVSFADISDAARELSAIELPSLANSLNLDGLGNSTSTTHVDKRMFVELNSSAPIEPIIDDLAILQAFQERT